MEPKKQRELERRQEALPFHYIDACILTEMLLKQNRRGACISYLNKFPNYQKGSISTVSMGEVITTLLTKLENMNVKITALELLDSCISARRIRIMPPASDVLAYARSIQEIDSRIDTTDAINLACAIENEAKVFVTFDEDLLNNDKLERAFKIKIREPSMLV